MMAKAHFTISLILTAVLINITLFSTSVAVGETTTTKKWDSREIDIKKKFYIDTDTGEPFNGRVTEVTEKKIEKPKTKFQKILSSRKLKTTREGDVRNGLREGLWKFTFDVFSVNEVTYKAGVLHGPSRMYMGGKILSEQNYVEGQLDGKSISYDVITGQIKSETNYKNDREHGSYKMYRPDGQLWSFKTYKHGALHGPATRYHENGEVTEQGNYKNGKKDGPWIIILRGAEKRWAETRNYKNGELVPGSWRQELID